MLFFSLSFFFARGRNVELECGKFLRRSFFLFFPRRGGLGERGGKERLFVGGGGIGNYLRCGWEIPTTERTEKEMHFECMGYSQDSHTSTHAPLHRNGEWRGDTTIAAAAGRGKGLPRYALRRRRRRRRRLLLLLVIWWRQLGVDGDKEEEEDLLGWLSVSPPFSL